MRGYKFGLDAARRIRDAVKQVESPDTTLSPSAAQYGIALEVFIAKTGGGGVTALSGTTPGSGSVTVQRINDSDELEAVTDTNGDDVTKTVWNLSNEAVAANTYIQCKQEVISGKFLIDFEVC